MQNSPPERILVLGSTGQVGRSLVKILGTHCIAISRPELELANPSSLSPLFDRIQPNAVINAAAYTAVDLAEKEPALAMSINGEAPGVIATWCARHDIPFVHFSTDYVFSGEGNRPWREGDPTMPVNAYGKSKREGEKKVMESGAKAMIFRTSWVYDAEGKNFFTTMLRLGQEKSQLKIVSDQCGAPTYAPHLAQAASDALTKALKFSSFPSGIYHLCHSGQTNWYEFAMGIFDSARTHGMELKVNEVEAIPSSAYPTPAERPLNSRLDLEKLRRVFNIQLPDWETGLSECLAMYLKSRNL